MKTALIPVLAFTSFLAACGGAASSAWDPQAASALRNESEALLHDLDAGNVADMLARMDEASVVLDLDENNHPVRVDGRAKVTAYLGGLGEAMKKEGLRFHSTIARNDCSAISDFGYCVLEFDQTVTAGGQTMPPSKFRATVVARRTGEGWRWTHWHGSFRETPPAPAPAPAPAAAK